MLNMHKHLLIDHCVLPSIILSLENPHILFKLIATLTVLFFLGVEIHKVKKMYSQDLIKILNCLESSISQCVSNGVFDKKWKIFQY